MRERIREHLAFAIGDALRLLDRALWTSGMAIADAGSAIGRLGTAAVDEYVRRAETREAARARARAWHE